MFTCTTCDIEFDDHVEQSSHYRSSWHMFNCKRKVDNESSVSHEEYSRLFDAGQKMEVAFDCRSCGKRFNRRDSLENHERTHAMEVEREHVVVSERVCVFCSVVSGGLEECVRHMQYAHGFVVPPNVDVKDYTDYCRNRVFNGHTCVQCNRRYSSIDAVRAHMTDSGHRIPKCDVLVEEVAIPSIKLEKESAGKDYSELYIRRGEPGQLSAVEAKQNLEANKAMQKEQVRINPTAHKHKHYVDKNIMQF